jgi:cathepsin X
MYLFLIYFLFFYLIFQGESIVNNDRKDNIIKQNINNEYKIFPLVIRNQYQELPYQFLDINTLPSIYDLRNYNGKNYLTKSLNQHIPQYCGSCWAHGAMSSLADRIKLARKGKGIDINLSIQYILNCGSELGGSCYGGSAIGAYHFVIQNGFIPYDTCQPYLACSSDSKEGFCKYIDVSCSKLNTCRTCSTFSENGGKCVGLDYFPNATIAEYGTVTGIQNMKAEIFTRGPIACGINANPVLNYQGGIYDDPNQSTEIDHIISVVGWGKENNQSYWIIRNSWGEYWGEMGFMRLKMGGNQLGIEMECSWATPGSWTEMNKPCYEDGSNCQQKIE